MTDDWRPEPLAPRSRALPDYFADRCSNGHERPFAYCHACNARLASRGVAVVVDSALGSDPLAEAGEPRWTREQVERFNRLTEDEVLAIVGPSVTP